MLEDTYVSLEKARKYIRDFDFNDPKFTFDKYIKAMKEVPQLIKQVLQAKELVEKEILENDKIRGNKQKTILDDGLDGFMRND